MTTSDDPSRELYVDFPSLTEPLPEATLHIAANAQDPMMRWRLTEYPFVLPDDLFLQLVNDPEEGVRVAAICHGPASAQQIDAGVRARPELREIAVHHPHASLDLMNDRPLGASDGPDRRHYLDLVRADADQRQRFFTLIDAIPLDEHLAITLGRTWKTAQSRSDA